MTEVDIHRIREILPHRYPFLLIDRVTEHVPDGHLVAVKNVTANEPCFQGHFPHYPVYPGVLILESIAQAAAILTSLSIGASSDDRRVYLFAGIDKARFRRPVSPGDQMHIRVEMTRRVKDLWRAQGEVTVDGARACSAEVLYTYREVE